jgi:hypothetical protein
VAATGSRDGEPGLGLKRLSDGRPSTAFVADSEG